MNPRANKRPGTYFLFLASFCLILHVGSACAAAGACRVCVTRIPAGERWDANDTGAKESSTFTVQLDNLPAVLVTTNVSGVFTNLSLAGEHAVTIRLDGKPLTSFRFSFKGRGDHLRLWYNPFYGSWSLLDVRPGEKCACPKLRASYHSMQRTDDQDSIQRSADRSCVSYRASSTARTDAQRWPEGRKWC
jgi:hypothetical protein